MTRKAQFLETIESQRSALKDLGVNRLGLFGSVLREEDTAESDLDVLVEFRPGYKSFDRLYELHELLTQSLNCKIDLVTRRSLSPIIGPKILKEVDYVQVAS